MNWNNANRSRHEHYRLQALLHTIVPCIAMYCNITVRKIQYSLYFN